MTHNYDRISKEAEATHKAIRALNKQLAQTKIRSEQAQIYAEIDKLKQAWWLAVREDIAERGKVRSQEHLAASDAALRNFYKETKTYG